MERLDVVQFGGLNSTVSPELIDNGEARDIVNLRHDKVGKLVTRNGYVYGLKTLSYRSPTSSTYPVLDSDTNQLLSTLNTAQQNTEFIKNLGIVGLGELVLETNWAKFDTDRFMVYAIKTDSVHGASGGQPTATRTGKLGYLLAPLTGKYQNQILVSITNGNLFTKIDSAQSFGAAQDLYAPMRGQGIFDDVINPQSELEDNYIDQYVDIKQYRNRAVISDRINGDYLIEDEYSLQDDLPENERKHELRFRANALDIFDIDKVKIEARLSSGEENDKTVGVENGLGLYNYELPEKDFLLTIDNAENYLSSEDFLGEYTPAEINTESNKSARIALARKLEEHFTQYQTTTLLTLYHWMPGWRMDYGYYPKGAKKTITTAEVPPKTYRVLENAYFDAYNRKKWGTDQPDEGQFAQSPIGGEVSPQRNNNDGGVGTSGGVTYTGFIPGGDNWFELLNLFRYAPRLNTKGLYYRFTNAEQSGKFRSVLEDVRLPKEKQTGKKKTDEVQDDIPADVYVWEDVKVRYYPTVGQYSVEKQNAMSDISLMVNEAIYYFLSDKDRTFTKLDPNLPKIKNLLVKDKYGRLFPLGVWRYKFVWDYGNGIYSQPSVDLAAPDIMWCTEGSEVLPSLPTQLNKEHDDRVISFFTNSTGAKDPDGNQIGNLHSQYPDLTTTVIGGSISPGAIKLTNIGENLHKIKDALYDSQFKFGRQTATTTEFNALGYNQNTPQDTLNLKKVQDFGCLITGKFPRQIDLKGTIWEGFGIAQTVTGATGGKGLKAFFDNDGRDTPYLWEGSEGRTIKDLGRHWMEQAYNYVNRSNTSNAYLYDNEQIWYVQNKGGITIPFKQTPSQVGTYNSIFDDEGRLRVSRGTFKQFVLPGHNAGFGTKGQEVIPIQAQTPLPDENNPLVFMFGSVSHREYQYSQMLGSKLNSGVGSNIYLNLVNVDYDYNNSPLGRTNNEMHLYRVPSILRAAEEAERLINTKSSVPNLAVDRLIKQGIIELKLLDKAEEAGWDTEYYNLGMADLARQVAFGTLRSTKDTKQTFRELTYPFNRRKAGVRYGFDNNTQNYSWFLTQTKDAGFFAYWDNEVYRVFLDKYRAQNMGEDPDSTAIDTFKNKARELEYEFLLTEYQDYVNWAETQMGEDWDTRSMNFQFWNYLPHPTTGSRDHYASNIEVYTYNEGERLIALEQLTSLFPSSLLFNAPRLGLNIANADIPSRAKKLLIFRTKSSHSNDYEPNKYGLVETLDITRDGSGNVNTGDKLNTLYYFDTKKDSELNFAFNPENYNGLWRPLRSRFNLSLNERTYYANFRLAYNPLKPRSYINYTDEMPNQYAQLVECETADIPLGFPVDKHWRYALIYEDLAGNKSEPIYSPNMTFNTSKFTNDSAFVVLDMTGYQIDNTTEKLKIFRSALSDTPITTPSSVDYFFLDEVKDFEGIYVDRKKATTYKLTGTTPIWQDYPSGIMYSESYRPDWIKAENFREVKSGDGSVITGLHSLYGNLIVFKENSVHRLAVQGGDDPISRIDELEPNIGCIAPNASINVSNTLYFLSWRGLFRYDNNQFQKADGKFDEELQFFFQPDKKALIRHASMGYNPSTNEIYLNMPYLNSPLSATRGYTYGSKEEKYDFEKEILGHIFVLNLDKGYATKYSYSASDYINYDDSLPPSGIPTQVTRYIVNQLGNVRKYYTNSLGELRSADITTSYYGELDTQGAAIEPGNISHRWAAAYVETPYNDNDTFDTKDETLDVKTSATKYGSTAGFFDISAIGTNWNFVNDSFPISIKIPIFVKFKSKFFSATESISKRLRKFVGNLWSNNKIKITLNVVPRRFDETLKANNRIDNQNLTQSFEFNPTINKTSTITGVSTTGTGSPVLSVVPNTETTPEKDFKGKPVLVSVEIESKGRTEINQISLHWRPIHTYLS